MKKHSYSAIILAAGLSSRMGKLKALLNWHGKPLIQYQIDQMQAAGVKQIYVVLGYKADLVQEYITSNHVEIVINEHYLEGKSSSIRKGIAMIDQNTDGIFVTAVDQPVPAQTLKQLLNELEKTKASIMIPTYKEKRGHPILFAGNMRKELLHIKEETQGLREIIQKYEHKIFHVPATDCSILLNFNRLEDYKKYSL